MFKVMWTITNLCNYNCRYCFYKGSHKLDYNLTQQKIDLFINLLTKLKYNEYDITITGGEPTLSPNLFYIINELIYKLGERLKKFDILTNLSKSDLSYYDPLFNISHNDFTFRISIHPEYWSQQKKETLIYLMKHFQLNIQILFDTKDYNSIKDIVEFLKPYKDTQKIELRKLIEFNILKYTNEDEQYFNEVNSIFHLPKRKEQNILNLDFETRKYGCTFGKEYLYINSDLTFRTGYCQQEHCEKLPIIMFNPKKLYEKIALGYNCSKKCCNNF